MNTDITSSYLAECVDCFTAVRQRLFEGATYLHKISKEELWKESGASSFGEWVEERCKISQSMASKLVSVIQHYEVEGGISHEELAQVDNEKLYLAAKLPIATDEQFQHARTLSRSELKQTKAENDAHTPSFGEYCSVCWLSKANHPQ